LYLGPGVELTRSVTYAIVGSAGRFFPESLDRAEVDVGRSRVVGFSMKRGLFAATLIVVVMATPAWGNAFGDPWNESNFQRYWYEAAFGTQWRSSMNWVRTNDINPTHMYTETRANHDDSDVAVYWESLAGTIVGDATCIDPSGTVCRHWHVRFNSNLAPYTETERRHISCHEFGHTLGLHHYPDSNPNPGSCMKESYLTTYAQHDVNHIDAYYPNNPNG
jgi:hypothetical protein